MLDNAFYSVFSSSYRLECNQAQHFMLTRISTPQAFKRCNNTVMKISLLAVTQQWIIYNLVDYNLVD